MSGSDPSDPIPSGERLPAVQQYVVGLLRRAADRPVIREEENERIEAAHEAHLARLKNAGELVVFGPFEGEGDLRGILIFRAGPVERVRRFAEEDPAVVNHRLVIELFPWSAPAGLQLGKVARAESEEEP